MGGGKSLLMKPGRVHTVALFPARMQSGFLNGVGRYLEAQCATVLPRLPVKGESCVYRIAGADWYPRGHPLKTTCGEKGIDF